MESTFRVNTEGTWLEERDLAFRMNEYDEYALEQAIRIKEATGNAPDITVLSIGPARVVGSHQERPWPWAPTGAYTSRMSRLPRKIFQIASTLPLLPGIKISTWSLPACNPGLVRPRWARCWRNCSASPVLPRFLFDLEDGSR